MPRSRGYFPWPFRHPAAEEPAHPVLYPKVDVNETGGGSIVSGARIEVGVIHTASGRRTRSGPSPSGGPLDARYPSAIALIPRYAI